MKLHTVVFAILVVLVTGCTSKRPPLGQHADACELMPKGAVEKVLGVQVAPAQSQSFGENPRQTMISNCLYVSAPSAATGPAQLSTLSFTVRTETVAAAKPDPAEAHILTMKQDFGQRYELKKLDGLGKGAVWDNSLKQLTVFQGSNTYVWNAAGSTLPDLENKLVALAKKTVAAS